MLWGTNKVKKVRWTKQILKKNDELTEVNENDNHAAKAKICKRSVSSDRSMDRSNKRIKSKVVAEDAEQSFAHTAEMVQFDEGNNIIQIELKGRDQSAFPSDGEADSADESEDEEGELHVDDSSMATNSETENSSDGSEPERSHNEEQDVISTKSKKKKCRSMSDQLEKLSSTVMVM